MRDIPVFTTEYGVASLTLKEIPYRAEAYVRIQCASDLNGLMEECVKFCQLAGADRIYATGHVLLENYPLHTTILQMRRENSFLPESDAELIPVTDTTLSTWLSIYNEKMRNVSNATYMTFLDGQKMLEKGNAYFVYQNGVMLGIGIASDSKVDVVAAIVSGAGECIMRSLIRILTGSIIEVEVASDNLSAIKLYNRMGFEKTAEIMQWYSVL